MLLRLIAQASSLKKNRDVVTICCENFEPLISRKVDLTTTTKKSLKRI